MWFNYLVLLTALVLSGTAAYYSIIGLTAIFSAAFWPIVIMGSVLEAGKVVTSVWLHRYWDRATWQYKTYLVPAVAFLMLLTSMGIFGFLSKAHSDQSLVSGDSQAKVAIYDEKIKISRENIDASRKALKQMDESVDQVMSRSSDEKGADKAVALRRSQQRERTRLLTEIEQEQKKITALNEERAPLAAESRKIEAEVGPIKYIAALIYDENPDANVLEKAVRLVIIMIVLVFDPLAIALILASTQGMAWERIRKKPETLPDYPEDDGPLSDPELEQIQDAAPKPVDLDQINSELSQASDTEANLEELESELKALTAQPESLNSEDTERISVLQATIKELEEKFASSLVQISDLETELSQARDNLRFSSNKVTELEGNLEINFKKIEQLRSNLGTVKDDSIAKDGTIADLTSQKEDLEAVIVELDQTIQTLEQELQALRTPQDLPDPEPGPEPLPLSIIPELTAPVVTDNLEITSRPSEAGFGNTFPDHPEKGDMFVRVDVLPNQAYKFNGVKWIEVDKNQTDTYLENPQYVNYLMEKLSSGEVELESLTDAEQTEIKKILAKEKVLGK
mgnify:FL=1